MSNRRENGAGTEPKQEPNGRWVLKVSYRDMDTGELKRKTIRGESQGNVLAKKKEFLKSIEAGVKPGTNKLSYQRWLQTWLEVEKKGKVESRTYANYENVVNNHITDSDLGKLHIDRIKRSDIQKFINKKAAEYKPGTIALIKMVIADSLQVAEIERLIVVSPCKKITAPKTESKEVMPLQAGEIKKLLEAAGVGSLMYGIIFTALRTGMREGEIAGLQWDDIDFQTGTISIKRQAKIDVANDRKLILGDLKTDSSYRIIPLEKKLAEVLTVHKVQQAKEKLALGEAYQKNGLIFAEADGSIISPQNICTRFVRLIEKIGIKRRTFHQLRHTFASVGISKGMNIKTVSAILGHTKINITLDTYGHLLPGDMESVVNAIAAFYDS